MEVLSLIISIIALLCAYVAYTKSGGSVEELKRKVEDLGLSTETLRSRMANILENLEKRVRGEEKKCGAQPDNKDPAQHDARV
jgi:hypothetical protein